MLDVSHNVGYVQLSVAKSIVIICNIPPSILYARVLGPHSWLPFSRNACINPSWAWLPPTPPRGAHQQPGYPEKSWSRERNQWFSHQTLWIPHSSTEELQLPHRCLVVLNNLRVNRESGVAGWEETTGRVDFCCVTWEWSPWVLQPSALSGPPFPKFRKRPDRVGSCH